MAPHGGGGFGGGGGGHGGFGGGGGHGFGHGGTCDLPIVFVIAAIYHYIPRYVDYHHIHDILQDITTEVIMQAMQHMGITVVMVMLVIMVMVTGEVITTDGMVSLILFVYFQPNTI